MSDNLKKKTVNGLLWSCIERFSVQGVQFIISIIMARILTPKDYGLIGMLTIFIALSQSFIDSGFSQALIRKQDRTEVDNSTVFYFNIVVSLLLYGALYVSAPYVSDFYNVPELTPIMRVVCISIIFVSLSVVQRAHLTGRLDFKAQAKASLLAAVISGIVGVWMAYQGYGVWALAVQQILSQCLNTLFLWIVSEWRPVMVYSWSSFRNLFSFGSKLMAVGVIDTLYRNIFAIIIGKVFSAASLGFYTRAQSFSDLPSSNITGILQRVTYPVLCSIQNDDARLASVYRRFLKLSVFVMFPLMVGLASVATPLILVLLGEQWKFTAVLLQIICFSMMWYPVHSINLNLLQVKGRSDLFLKLEIIKKIFLVIVLVVTVPMGLLAMCYGQIVTSLFSLVVNTYYTGRFINVGFSKQMKDLFPTLLLSLSMGGLVFSMIFLFQNVYIQLLTGVSIGFFYYFFMARVFGFTELHELFLVVNRKKSEP